MGVLQHRLISMILSWIVAGPAAGQTVPSREPARPALIVFITVDQLRPDYFERYADQLTGGLHRLWTGGAVFTRGYQDHANTETAPGHASTLSGRFPRSTGIVMNSAGVQDPQHPLVGTPGPGASPFRFRGTTLIDWMRTADQDSRALSVSRKDRGAILPLGRAHQPVFWWAPEGIFTSSTFYGDTLPDWVGRFNARRTPQRMAGAAWTLLLDAGEYPEPDTVIVENQGRGNVFPHRLPNDSAMAGRAFAAFPWLDSLTLDFALEGVTELGLGDGGAPDLLAVSLSTTDAVGHAFGPDSRELHDQVLRLDRYLGAFIDSLYELRDSSTIAFALTADHGVAPFPAVHAGRNGNAADLFVDLRPAVAGLRTMLIDAGLDSSAAEVRDGMLFIHLPAFEGNRVGADSIVRGFAAMARRIPGVLRVDIVSGLAAKDTTNDAIARRWYHMLPADLPVEAVVTLEPYHVGTGVTYAQHGSPHDYDAHVPIIFYGPFFAAGYHDTFVRVVDMAPTLARIARIAPTEALDGHVLSEAIR
ncbi:MAG: alkaline phosphatase family protein [Gemmatimonadaceae bacterium]